MKRKTIISTLILFFTLFLISSPLWSMDKELNIAMVLWRGETDAEKGFKDRLKELGFSVKYTILNADQKIENLSRLLDKHITLQNNEFDYIYSFGTTASTVTHIHIKNQIPHIFNVVTDPIKAGIVKDLEASGSNISGVSHKVPLSLQIETALRIKKFKKLAFLFNALELNSNIIFKELTSLAKKFNFEIVPLRASPSKEGHQILQKHLNSLINQSIEADAIYLPLDSFIVSNAKLIGEQLRKAKLISIAAQRDYIDSGALLGIVPDYYQLGKAAATILEKHQKGKKLEDIPIYTVKNPKLIINKTSQNLLGIAIPSNLLDNAVIIE